VRATSALQTCSSTCDVRGTELNCLRNHSDVTRLEYLPYHWLLVSIVRVTLSSCCLLIPLWQGKAGYLKYQDTSTGKVVIETRTKLVCLRDATATCLTRIGVNRVNAV
jgi:hypothetical protein